MTQRYAQFWLFRKGSGNSFPTIFYVWFFRKNVSDVIFCYVTDQASLSDQVSLSDCFYFLRYWAICALQLLDNHNTSNKFWDQSPFPPLSMLFGYIWDSFLAQASELLLFQYAATLSRGKGPDLFLQRGPFKNFHKFFQELTWSQ